MGDEVRMDAEAVATVKGDFAGLRDLATTGGLATPRQVAGLREAAGEFLTELQDGADTFELGWLQVFDLAGTAARLVVTNVDELHLELTTVDENAAGPMRGGPQ